MEGLYKVCNYIDLEGREKPRDIDSGDCTLLGRSLGECRCLGQGKEGEGKEGRGRGKGRETKGNEGEITEEYKDGK